MTGGLRRAGRRGAAEPPAAAACVPCCNLTHPIHAQPAALHPSAHTVARDASFPPPAMPCLTRYPSFWRRQGHGHGGGHHREGRAAGQPRAAKGSPCFWGGCVDVASAPLYPHFGHLNPLGPQARQPQAVPRTALPPSVPSGTAARISASLHGPQAAASLLPVGAAATPHQLHPHAHAPSGCHLRPHPFRLGLSKSRLAKSGTPC